MQPSLATPRSGRKILVVEDQKIVARDLQRTLEELGWTVVGSAASCDEAVAICTRDCPDLVLMDIHIKGPRDGIETASLLASRFGVGHLFVTAYPSEATLEKAQRTGPLGYLTKPVASRDLATALQSASARRQLALSQQSGAQWPSVPKGDAVILVDDARRVVAMNAAARRLARLSEGEVEERSLDELLLAAEGASRATVGAGAQRLLDEGCAVQRSDGALLASAGAARDRLSRGAIPVVDEAGLKLGDIVTTHGAPDARRLRRQLEESDRLASLGSLATGIAHDLGNPLAYVSANVEFAQAEVAACRRALEAGAVNSHLLRRLAEIEEALHEARTGCKRVVSIASDLKAQARGGQADLLGPVSLRRLLKWVVASSMTEVVRRARLFADFDGAPEVLGDDIKLGRVFTNLVSNAPRCRWR